MLDVRAQVGPIGHGVDFGRESELGGPPFAFWPRRLPSAGGPAPTPPAQTLLPVGAEPNSTPGPNGVKASNPYRRAEERRFLTLPHPLFPSTLSLVGLGLRRKLVVENDI